MQDFVVASGLIVDAARLVVVQNRRKNGSLDWSTPGGVVDPGEGPIEALSREVVEETGLRVCEWSPLLYSVDVDFPGRDLSLHARVYQALDVAGVLTIDDPDGVVIDGRWVEIDEALRLLESSPRWVAEPLVHALSAGPLGDLEMPPQISWRYVARYVDGAFDAELIEGPDGI